MLDKFAPNFIIVGDDLERRRQTEVVPIALEQPHAEAVDRPEKSAIERGQDLEWDPGLQYFSASALLHFVRSTLQQDARASSHGSIGRVSCLAG